MKKINCVDILNLIFKVIMIMLKASGYIIYAVCMVIGAILECLCKAMIDMTVINYFSR